MKEHINQILLAGIMGITSLGVNYMRDLSHQVQTISQTVIESRTESNLRFNQLSNGQSDHEVRLREIERQISKRR